MMGGRRDREKARALARKATRQHARRRPCPRCGSQGPHFVPPGAGDAGFFICEAKKGER